MITSIVGDVDESSLAPGWESERIVALIGDVRLDLRNRPPTESATLRVFRLVGDVRVRVAPGTRVVLSGFTLIGDRKVDIGPGDSPTLKIKTSGLVGDVEIYE